MADATMDSNETLDADGALRRSVLKAVAAVPLLAAMAARARADEPPVPQPPASSLFVKHAYDEHQVDLGEVVMNYATVGSPGKPALVLIPPQTRSWWNFEAAMKLLAPDLQVFAVDLRGQGVRFVIRRPRGGRPSRSLREARAKAGWEAGIRTPIPGACPGDLVETITPSRR